MRSFWVILLSFSTCLAFAQDLEQLREAYPLAVNDKNLCNKWIKQLETNPQSAIQWGYLGAFQTIWANHTFSPFSKLTTFKKGKNNLEKAIRLDAKNAELRWLRLNIQLHAPSFLGYKDDITKDKQFIKANRNQIHSNALLRQMKDVGLLD